MQRTVKARVRKLDGCTDQGELVAKGTVHFVVMRDWQLRTVCVIVLTLPLANMSKLFSKGRATKKKIGRLHSVD